MLEKSDFDEVVRAAAAKDRLESVRPALEKEFLHWDIMFVLHREGLLKNLVFQGGTSLRLCHKSNRFSEDLDFAGGASFANEQMKGIKEAIEDYIGGRYGLECNLKEPRQLRSEPNGEKITVDKWQLSVTTSPERPDLPRQKIKIEVANVPAHTKELQILQPNHDFLPGFYSHIVLQAETLPEIMADKLVAFPNMIQEHVRYRDIWDFGHLRQKGVEVDPDLVRLKLGDYRVEDYDSKLEAAISRLPQIIEGADFQKEMGRFIPTPVLQRTIDNPQFREVLTREVSGLMIDVRKALYPLPEDKAANLFQM